MNPIDRLIATEEIKKLKATYFYSMDTKNEALYRSVLTEDYRFDAVGIITDPITGFSPFPDAVTDPVKGRDACAKAIFAAIAHPDYHSIHIGHMPIIEIIDADNATGVWSMTDAINAPGENGTVVTFVGYGHYHDTYRREDGVWKIASVRLDRIRVDYPLEESWREKTRRGSGTSDSGSAAELFSQHAYTS